MRVPKHIKVKVTQLLDMESYRQTLMSDIYNWIEEQGIDTSEDKFIDGIGAALHYSEFDSVDEFITEVKEYKSSK